MRLLLSGGLALVLLTAACGDDPVAPKSPADPQATAAQLAALGAVFDNPALQSLSAVSAEIMPAGAPPVPALALVGVTNPLTRSAQLKPYAERIDGARMFSRLLPEMSASGVAALFPPALEGKTFEWNFTTQQYDTTARAGAPSTGVRFILYAISPLTGYPAGPAPGTEVGYVDLIDESGTGNPKVHVIVAGAGGTPRYVDYTVSIANQTTITTAGYITDGASSPDSIQFNGKITVGGSATSITVTEDISFDVNSHDIHVRNWQQVTFTETTLSLRISFRFEYAGEVVTLDGTLNANDAGDVTGTFTSRVDGGLFATCSVTGTATTYTLTCQGADEDGLSADDQTALDALGEASSGVSGLFEGILAPAIGVLGN